MKEKLQQEEQAQLTAPVAITTKTAPKKQLLPTIRKTKILGAQGGMIA
jgi:hypothetical protein